MYIIGESLSCSFETNVTLYINYIPIKNDLKIKNKQILFEIMTECGENKKIDKMFAGQ